MAEQHPESDDLRERLLAELERALALAEEVEGIEARRDALERELSALRRDMAGMEALREGAERTRKATERVERIGRQVRQAEAAGQLSGAPLAALPRLLDDAGVVMRGKPTPRITEFLEGTYLAAAELAEDNRRHIEGYIRVFAMAVGDKQVGAVTLADLQGWMGKLSRLPTNYGKGGKDRGKSLDRVLREARQAKLATINETTVGKHVTHVKRFLLTAAANRLIPADDVRAMFDQLKVPSHVPRRSKRTRWPLPELSALLASPMWTGTRSRLEDRVKRHEAGPRVHLDAYWWLPVLGLFTGARLEELAQLRHEDLRADEETGLPCFDVTDEGEGGRRVKTETSRRRVPIHPFLEALRVRELFRPGRRGWIFPELKPAGRPLKRGGQFSEDFTAYRRAIGVYAPLRDFHALRHTFVSGLRAAGVDAGLVAQVVGHQEGLVEADEQQTQTYTQFTLAERAAGLARLDWAARGLDLSHLLAAVELAGGPRGTVMAEDVQARAAEIRGG